MSVRHVLSALPERLSYEIVSESPVLIVHFIGRVGRTDRTGVVGILNAMRTEQGIPVETDDLLDRDIRQLILFVNDVRYVRASDEEILRAVSRSS